MSDNEKDNNNDIKVVAEKIKRITYTRQKYKGWYFVKTY